MSELVGTTANLPHRVMATMFAAGYSDSKIKDYLETLGHRISPRALKIYRQSPLMQSSIGEVEREIKERTVSKLVDIQDRLQAEALPSIKVLTEVRDGFHEASASDRRGASNDLLSFVVPKRSQSESVNHNVLHLSPETIEAMRSVMIEAGHQPPALPEGGVIEAESVSVSEPRVGEDGGPPSRIDPAPSPEGRAGFNPFPPSYPPVEE